MRFRRVLFISPHYPANHYGGINYYPPMGIAYLCEVLKHVGVETSIVDMGRLWPLEYLFEQIDSFAPELIAVSMMTFRYRHHYELVDAVKSRYPSIPIVAGGPHVTAWKARVLEQCGSLDLGVSLEGEYTMKELCEGVEIDAVKGLLHRDADGIRFNGERDLIADLDGIPFPKYESIDLSQYFEVRLLCSSRGCPYHCTFCQSKSMLGTRFRARSAANIFAEIMFWYERGSRIFNFVDDNFTLDKQRVAALCRLIIDAGICDLDLYASGVRADKVDHDLLQLMKQAGFSHLSFGVEATSNSVLKFLKKHETIEEIEAGVKMARDMGFYVTLYFMVGSPYETMADVKRSIAFAKRYATGGCNFGSIMPIPDTELMDWVNSNGRLLMEPDYYLNELAEYERVSYFDGPGMTLEEKRLALQITENAKRKIDRRYQQRKWINNLRRDLKQKGLIQVMAAKTAHLLSHNRLTRHVYNNSAVVGRLRARLRSKLER